MLNLKRFTSNISQKESLDLNKHDVQFANILLCSDSIHSKVKYFYRICSIRLESNRIKQRVFERYPKVNISTVRMLYGLNVDPIAEVSVWQTIILTGFYTPMDASRASKSEFIQTLWQYRTTIPYAYRLARQLTEGGQRLMIR